MKNVVPYIDEELVQLLLNYRHELLLAGSPCPGAGIVYYT